MSSMRKTRTLVYEVACSSIKRRLRPEWDWEWEWERGVNSFRREDIGVCMLAGLDQETSAAVNVDVVVLVLVWGVERGSSLS